VRDGVGEDVAQVGVRRHRLMIVRGSRQRAGEGFAGVLSPVPKCEGPGAPWLLAAAVLRVPNQDLE
jgi:hypothetical protein